jgi:alanyl-tRNA synthetase
MVAADRLRFDFTHFSQIDPDALERIETFVNQRVRQNVPVAVEEMDMDHAMKSGATALFEEKYGDRVRVVALDTFSRELCGGTHTGRTGNIGLFKIFSESSVASGVRRIEAFTGSAALGHVQKTSRILQQVSHLIKDKPETAVKRVESMMTSLKSLEKEKERLKTKMAEMQADGSSEQVLKINGITAIIQQVTVDKPSALRELADRFKDRIGSGVVVLGCQNDDKALLIVVVTKDLNQRFHAGRMIKQIASVVGGGGGGRPDMAQAGGTQPQNLPQALEKARALIEQG